MQYRIKHIAGWKNPAIIRTRDIAAAPDLLEALNRLECQSELSLESADPARVAARKAIRKARGEK